MAQLSGKLINPSMLILISVLNGFSTSIYAAECSLPLSTKNQNEQIWPYLANSTVKGVFDEPVTLRAGQYQGLPFVTGGQSRPELRLWPELMVSGDLDGKPGDEKIGLLSETSGGSGERLYLLATVSEQGQFHALPAVLLGDRVKVRSMEVHDRQIILHIVEAGPNQPFCCGTQLSQMTWRLKGGRLILKTKTVQGELSIDTLQGKHWYLLDRPGDRLNSLHPSCTQMHIQGRQVRWEIDGQQYSGTINETSPGHIVISDVLSEGQADETPQARLANDLMAVTEYTFRAGRLYLQGRAPKRALSFEFAPITEPK